MTSKTSKRKPISAQLAAVLGGKWNAVRNGMTWRYECDDGRSVRPYSESIFGYDGYSDTDFATVYYDDSGNRVPITSALPLANGGAA